MVSQHETDVAGVFQQTSCQSSVGHMEPRESGEVRKLSVAQIVLRTDRWISQLGDIVTIFLGILNDYFNK